MQAQCLVYRGPDVKYQGRDICYGYNEDTLTIYDVTDKKASKVISRTSVGIPLSPPPHPTKFQISLLLAAAGTRCFEHG